MTPAGPEPQALAALSRLHRDGNHAALEAGARRLLRDHPQHGFLWKALGVACAGLGKTDEELSAKQRAAQLLPGDAEAHNNLANALRARGRDGDAEASFRRAIQIDPSLANAWGGLGQLLGAQGRYAPAVTCLQRVAALLPDSPDAHNQLGNLLREAHRMREAHAAYERALALRPEFPEVLSNLGNTLADLGLVRDAEIRYRQALALSPRRAEIHSNLGNLLKEQGRLAEAQAAYRTAVALDPEFAGAHSNLLLAMNHELDLAPALAKTRALQFGEFAAARAGGPLAQPGARASRPLKVGFVSGDLRNHPVGYFLEGLLAHLDPAEVKLHAYPTIALEDALTARIRPYFGIWRNIAGLSDEQAARLVHADGVDVLVDLAGHTAYNRLGLFAWRPAPVQASWLGYFATTGLAAMDWLLADRASITPADQEHFTERIWYLPHTRLCFQPPQGAPIVAPLPASASGDITFGSFQNLGKINDHVLGVWARVMNAVPLARLRLQNAQLGDAAVREIFIGRLRQAGIDPRRCDLHGRSPRRAYLEAHAEVDIVLDTFPYPGGTTTCEALWMGVPTLTLAGDRMLSRQGASLLGAAGLRDWIARDATDYVEIAAARASDVPALARLRAGLREHVSATPLFDAARFAADFTHALRGMTQSC